MSSPRISPGNRSEIGFVNNVIVTIAMRVMKARSGNLFTTMARQRKLFRTWLRFGGSMMPRGSLPRRETELVILRVAHLRSCDYEFDHHVRIGRTVGLSAADINSVKEGAEAPSLSARERLLLRAVDSMNQTQDIDDDLWSQLAELWSESELIELCMLISHYEMLATFIRTLRIKNDRFKQ